MVRDFQVRIATKFIHLRNVPREGVLELTPLLDYLTEIESYTDYRGVKIEKVKARYYWCNEDRTEFRFNIAFKEQVLTAVKRFADPATLKIINLEVPPAEKVDFKLRSFFAYKEGQEKFVNYLAYTESPIRLLPATTGAGKTVSSLVASSLLGLRTVIFISPRHYDTWMKDIHKFFDIEDDDILWISGGNTLRSTIARGQEGEITEKIILVSLATIQPYITHHAEENKVADDDGNLIGTGTSVLDEKYLGVPPEEFFASLGAGIKIVDEAHENLMFNCLLDCFITYYNNMYLTATLTKEMGLAKEMERLLYPPHWRCKVPPPPKHINLVGVHYRLDGFAAPLKHMSPMGYSHTTFEKSLMKSPKRREKYFDMIFRTIGTYHKGQAERGYKCLIWFSTTAMVKAFRDYMRKRLKGTPYKVSAYIAGSPKEDLYEPHFVISTQKKTGTGVDLPGLLNVFQTINISSKGENIQNFGRIRVLDKDENGEQPKPHWVYFFTSAIRQQVRYHKKRIEDFSDRMLTQSVRDYPEKI